MDTLRGVFLVLSVRLPFSYFLHTLFEGWAQGFRISVLDDEHGGDLQETNFKSKAVGDKWSWRCNGLFTHRAPCMCFWRRLIWRDKKENKKIRHSKKHLSQKKKWMRWENEDGRWLCTLSTSSSLFFSPFENLLLGIWGFWLRYNMYTE